MNDPLNYYRDALPCADLDVAIIWPLVRPVPGETEPLPATIQSTSGPVVRKSRINTFKLSIKNSVLLTKRVSTFLCLKQN